MYKLLSDSIDDDNYDFDYPDDEADCAIIDEFRSFYPLKEKITKSKLMNMLNNPDDELFGADETSKCSGDDEEEGKRGINDTYQKWLIT